MKRWQYETFYQLRSFKCLQTTAELSFPEERDVEISPLLGYPELQKPSPGSVSVITPASNEAGQQALRHAGDQLKENMRLPAFFPSLTSSFFLSQAATFFPLVSFFCFFVFYFKPHQRRFYKH